MDFNLLKFKKDRTPHLNSFKPKIFDTDLFWFLSLGSCFVVFVVTTLIGFNLFYSQYFESYKKNRPTGNFESLINMDDLTNTVNKRGEIINKESPIPPNPSI